MKKRVLTFFQCSFTVVHKQQIQGSLKKRYYQESSETGAEWRVLTVLPKLNYFSLANTGDLKRGIIKSSRKMGMGKAYLPPTQSSRPKPAILPLLLASPETKAKAKAKPAPTLPSDSPSTQQENQTKPTHPSNPQENQNQNPRTPKHAPKNAKENKPKTKPAIQKRPRHKTRQIDTCPSITPLFLLLFLEGFFDIQFFLIAS